MKPEETTMKTLKEQLTADIQFAVKKALEGAIQNDIFQGGIDDYVQSWMDEIVAYDHGDGEVMVVFGSSTCVIIPLSPKK